MKLKKIDETGKPYHIFAEVLESEAIDQFVSAMQQPCVVKGALMPDAHAGYTLPIGAVVACEGMVFPSYVGYDIGCGMCAVPTTFSRKDVEENKSAIFDAIYAAVPVGFNHNKSDASFSEALWEKPRTKFASGVFDMGGAKQLGTLGGGNHFIEIGYEATPLNAGEGRVWIIIHSGSRNLGHKIASHYMKLASPNGRASEGHFGFDTSSQNGIDYIADLQFALAFALENRRLIVERVAGVMQNFVAGAADWAGLINRNHNHAEFAWINMGGPLRQMKGVWIHRKGATHAENGMMGVIPGNMRDGSFIVRGKGSPDSLSSSSHGAGRVMGRAQAKAKLNLEEFQADMLTAGVKALTTEATLDESPLAYKNIFDVMRLQSDLVEVVAHVRPIINVKG